MTKEQLNFAKKSEKFVVICDNGTHEFEDYKNAAIFYNEHIKDKYVELKGVCGIVGMTLAYNKN